MGSVTLENVRKRFGEVEVIHGVDLDIKDEEFVVLVGPSGCGKSTLLRMIAGLESVSDGEIRIDGTRVNELHPKLRNIAMVFQNYALYAHMSVRDNICFPLKMRGTPKHEIDERVRVAAETLGLTSYLDRHPKHLSGGQRQRVAMGRAIVRDPTVFLFDEPLSNLDAKLRVQMRTEIRTLQQRLKTTTVYVTHDQIEAMTMADKIVAMNDGHVEQVGSPLELYDNPRNLFVAGFIGSPAMNMMEGRVVNGAGTRQIDLGGGVQVPVPDKSRAQPNQEVVLGVRPEALRLDPDDGLPAQVEVVEPTGPDIQVYATIHEHRVCAVFQDRHPLQAGERIGLKPMPERLHVFDKQTGDQV
ncbi:ABC transporter ATP-binding protein [Rhodovibrio salinarum]|uniref:ABC transporter ATP-binding protein n=1 Tax=Rhodovibrio salinarum TaxID=1087 RepID=A0A934UZH1_9PROT|nr:sn-glycerol-3-phosphate ABC transporter ATP-binding protein UgpC [Rhodovibrio salinarum]MBK1696404.1 ABC transporter ATP-binding protein [Rhodovibrio salinarum]